MANSVDPDEMAHYEPSHQDLHCLHKYLFWSAGMEGLRPPPQTHSLSTDHSKEVRLLQFFFVSM